MIDVNVLLPPWPFRRLPVETVDELAGVLAKHGIVEAWMGSAAACFERDLAGVNERLFRDCKATDHVRLVPWGAANPLAPDWRDDVRRCHDLYGMPGLRLTPTCHGYDLSAPELNELLGLVCELKMAVQIVVAWEDSRTQHPLFRIPPLETGPILSLVKQHPQLRVILLNALRSLTLGNVRDLATAGQVWFDIAMLEGVDGLSGLATAAGQDRVLLGTWFPMFYVESALLKFRETSLAASAVERVKFLNAQSVLSKSG